MKIIFNFGNNNCFDLTLDSQIKYIDLYKYIGLILNTKPQNILYLIYNGKILKKKHFFQYININSPKAFVNIIFQNTNVEYSPLNFKINEDFISLYNQQPIINLFEDVPLFLNEHDLNKIFKLNSDQLNENEKNELCTICNSSIINNNELGLIKCCHLFHYNCIYDYLSKYNIKCPNCNYNLKTYD